MGLLSLGYGNSLKTRCSSIRPSCILASSHRQIRGSSIGWNLPGPRPRRDRGTISGTVSTILVRAVYQDGQWLILDNLTNLLLQDSEDRNYEPLAILDYKGARRYLSAFW
jgi:hypothetical protein